MTSLLARFRTLMGAGLDISEHLGLLRGLAADDGVRQIVELGFRGGVSATALAMADKPLLCIDIEPCTDAVRKLSKLAPKFTFKRADSLKIDIPPCDLMHVDSLHTHDQLKAELFRHAPACRKWIVLHDTETFGTIGKDGSDPGLMEAINVFLRACHKDWALHLHLKNNNGLTLLRRLWP